MSTAPGTEWTDPAYAMPPNNIAIEWLAPSGGEPQFGKYCGVWMLENGLYVYYTPTFWRLRR